LIRHQVIPSVIVSGLIAVGALAGLARAAEPQQVAFRSLLTTVDVHLVQVGNDADHRILTEKQIGSNISTGATRVLEGALVTLTGLVDANKGADAEHGYALFLDVDGSTLLLAYEGKGTDTRAGGALTYKGGGTWHVDSGTGRYENSRGEGIYKYEGSPAKNVIDWTGTLAVADK
jgi:hypothetical protein